jgi:hypothetical protein
MLSYRQFYRRTQKYRLSMSRIPSNQRSGATHPQKLYKMSHSFATEALKQLSVV